MPEDGIFIDQRTGNVGVAMGGGVALRIALSPNEMRGLASELLRAADDMEARAADEANAVLARAGGLQ